VHIEAPAVPLKIVFFLTPELYQELNQEAEERT